MMDQKSKKIYYQDSGYPIQRNILDIPISGYLTEKKIGLSKVLSYTHYRLFGVSPLLSNSHWELLQKKDSIWHFFNGVSFANTPWVSTFETTLPRWKTENKSLQKIGVKALTGDSCKKLIAISDCTKEFQTRFLKEEFPSFSSHIIPKLTVIHPPQPPLIGSVNEKELTDDELIFTVVGADFFRKGGKEILMVFDRLLDQGASVNLQIISSLAYNDYASKATQKDLKLAKEIINKHPRDIIHFKSLTNEAVLEKLRHSHVGLLPTYGDTYGYSVLEAQACGCPVITTNIRALPEINSDERGWIIQVPKNRWGNGVLNTDEERNHFSEIITENLYAIITDIIENPEQICRKGTSSLKHIKKNHSPHDVARRLEQIYDEALNKN